MALAGAVPTWGGPRCYARKETQMPTYTWNGGPVVDRGLGRPSKLWWTSWNEGITLVRDADGNWSEVRNRRDDVLADFTRTLRGGYRQDLSDTDYTELVAAGYAAYIEVA